MRLKIHGLREIGLVRRDERQPAPIGEIEELRFDLPLLRKAVALDFDVQPVAEDARQRLRAASRLVGSGEGECAVERAVRPAGERDCRLRIRGERRKRHMRRIALLRVEIGARGDPHEISIARLALGEEDDIAESVVARQRPRPAVTEIDAELDAGDRLNARFRGFFRELQRGEEIVRVGDSERRLFVARRKFYEPAERKRPFTQRKRRVNMEMRKSGVGDGHEGGSPGWGAESIKTLARR